jgi:amino acid transporter
MIPTRIIADYIQLYCRVAIIYRITGSRAATIVLLIAMIIMYFFCAVNQVTTSSRQVFAFARDKGLPFHQFLSKVRPGSGVPANAVYVTLLFTCLLALIQIGVCLTSIELCARD